MGSGLRSSRRAYTGLGLALGLLGSSAGCSSEPIYTQPQRVVYVDRPVERVVYAERPAEAKSSPSLEAPTGLNLIEPIYWQPGLVVNRDDNHRFGFRGSEKEGLDQMKLLASVSEEEEAWVYIKTGIGEEAWIELGKNLTPEESEKISRADGRPVKGRIMAAVLTDNKYLGKFLAENSRMISQARTYHFHPGSLYARALEYIIEDARKGGEELTEIEKNLSRFRISVLDAIHSSSELAPKISTVARITDFWKGLDYSDAVRSINGTCILTVKKSAVETLAKKSRPDIGKDVIRLFETAEFHNINLPEKLQREHPDSPEVKKFRVETIKNICGELSKGDFNMEFVSD